MRKYGASTVAQHGIAPMVLTRAFGHTDLSPS
jgi:hypothetical protein